MQNPWRKPRGIIFRRLWPFTVFLPMLLLMTAALAQTAGRAQPPDPIAAGFRSMPPEARLQMFWRIFGPAWERLEIDHQLEEMQRAGVGGVMTCFTYPVALDDPARGIINRRFLSPEFLETLGYAAAKAQQLGLRFSVCGGTGWPFGGPSVRLSDAAQRLCAESVPPLPDGKGYALPPLREGERYLAAFCGRRDVSSAIHGDRLEAPGREPCRVFITGPTFMRVKRPSLGAEGYVVDHYSRDATQRYLDAVVAPLLQAVPMGSLHAVFCDSLEVYGANWTPDFREQFRTRRGYDLIPHLPDLFDSASPEAPDLRFDFWRTLAELAEEEFAQTVHAWCRQHGVAFALEAYGTPPMGFTAARQCDVPWGEQYEWKGFSFSRFATSGGHLAGKKILGAEAWTWAGVPNRLADSLSDLKLCSDLHFLSGENALTGVDFPYSPRSAGVPGWMPYYGPVLNENNPQWLVFPDFAAYINRCQWLLRQGQPVADIALYTPTEDVFADGPTDQMLLDMHLRDRLASGERIDEFGLQKSLRYHSDLISTLLMAGYNFDGIDFFATNALARVGNGVLIAGDGRYRIVILPHLTGMDLAALRKIARFCRSGGTVIATGRLPDRVYGLASRQTTDRLRALIQEMFGTVETGEGVTIHPYGRGKTIFAPDERQGLAAALAAAPTGPDMRVSPEQPEVGHVHRRAGRRDFYFIVNVGAAAAQFIADFRVTGRSASLWNPMDGSITPLPIASRSHGRTQIELSLPPRGSLFVCFAPEGKAGGSLSLSPKAQHPTSIEEPSATYQRLLISPWRVSFDGPDAPPPYETHDLSSWTEWPGAKFFSGRATYTGVFRMPAALPKRALLRFDQVHEVAEVVLNGHRAGSVWMPPFALEVTPWLKPGENRLQITVANLPVNRVLGLPDPDLHSLRAAYGDRFPDPEEKQLMSGPAPSGLIGPVTLLSSF